MRDPFWVVGSELPPDSAGDPAAHSAGGLAPVGNGGSPDPLTVFCDAKPGPERVPKLLES